MDGGLAIKALYEGMLNHMQIRARSYTSSCHTRPPYGSTGFMEKVAWRVKPQKAQVEAVSDLSRGCAGSDF
jgi:hypothetical protein